MPNKKRTASQTRWLQEHFNDPFVKMAHKQGLRSRASFKLEELQQKDKLIAPGGWSEFARKCVGDKGKVIACDILPIRPIPGVTFLQGDFREDAVFTHLYELIGGGADVVLSDMAPNMSGSKAIDQPRAMLLSELALDMARRVLKIGGTFVVKVFTGQGSQEYLASLRQDFNMVACGFKGHPLSGISPATDTVMLEN